MDERYKLKYEHLRSEVESVKVILERVTATSQRNGEDERSKAYEYAEMLVKRVLEVS